MTHHNKSFRHQFPANMATNVASFLLNIAVGLFIVPYYIRNLGVDAYGLIPLATSLTAYLSLITMSLNGAVSRYLVIDIQNQNIVSANRVFNTAFFSVTALVIALIPLLAVVSWFAPHIFNAPADIIAGTRLLFFFSMLSFLIGIIAGNFSVSAYAYNRLDIQNWINISGVVFRTLPVIIFFMFFRPGVAWVGAAFLIGALVALALSFSAWKKLTPYLSLRAKDFDRSKLGQITNMGWWLTINQVGSLLFLNADIIIVNLLFGAQITGEYGAVMQWPLLLRTMAGVFAGVFAPMVLILFARGDIEKMRVMCQKSVKFLGLCMALPIGLLCGFGSTILKLWLGPEFSKYALMLVIMCAHLSVNLSVLPLFSIQTALNKVKLPGWFTLISGLMMLVMALILGKYTSLGAYGVALAGAIMLTLKNMLFTPLYGAVILGIDKTSFFKPLIGGTVGTALVWLICAVINGLVVLDGWSGLVGFSVLISAVYCVFLWIFVIDKEEKKLIFSIILSK